MSERLVAADRLFDSRQYAAALADYEAILAAKPGHPEAMTGRALCLFQQGRFEQAVTALQELLPLLPDSDQLRLILAEAQLLSGQRIEAQHGLEEILVRSPDNAEAQLRLGRIYLDQERYEAANRCIAAVLAQHPEHVEALGYMGLMLIRFCQFDEAMQALSRAYRLAPDNVLVLNNLGRACKMMGDPEQALHWYRLALDLEPDNACVVSNYLFAFNYCASVAADYAADEHFRRAPHCRPNGVVLPEVAYEAVAGGGKLRIGYVSGDLYTHSVTYFLEPVLQQHDRHRFEVYCYSVGSTRDATTARLEQLSDCWRDMSAESPEVLARQIRSDRIDILVDLSGHTGDNRLGAFALRSAPVQVSWIGYPATSGLPEMDYYLTDDYCDPPGMTERFYTERLYRLPHSFCCYLPPMEFPPIAPLPCLSNGYITFGSFNNFAKVTQQQLALWARILQAVPEARLYLKSMALGTDSVKQRVLEQFAAAGVAPERILLRVVTKTPLEHLAEYGRVDIALDTFPYHGTTTTCEALWMGTPVVALTGTTHASRVAVSLLENAGCPELLAADEDEYLRQAVGLAADIDRLRGYRLSLRVCMAQSPLMDAVEVTREVERAFEEMVLRTRGRAES